MTVCGFTLTKDDINVKREFNGDAKRFEAASSEDGSLMIAIDTTCDEEVLQELRARTFAATVQKLRKSSGLVVSDRVEIFYEESGDSVVSKDGVSTLVSAAMLKHSASTVKRIKSLPLTMELCSKQAIIIIKEVITDLDISKKPITIMLTQPCIAVDTGAVALLINNATSGNTDPTTPTGVSVSNTPAMAAMYLQSMDYDRLLSLESVEVTVDTFSLLLKKGVHYFQSANEMILSPNFSDKNNYPNLPSSL